MTLDEIQKLCDHATTGPWYPNNDCVATNEHSFSGYPPDPTVIANLWDGEYIINPHSKEDVSSSQRLAR